MREKRKYPSGRVWTEVGFRLASNPDTVRAPDVAFVRHDRLPAKDARGFYRGAPDLAIEVLSPDDTPAEVREKVADYAAAGTPVAVIIDPEGTTSDRSPRDRCADHADIGRRHRSR